MRRPSRALSHLKKQGSTVRVMLLDFSSAFNTVQPCLLSEKVLAMQLHPATAYWIMDYRTGQSGVDGCASEVVISIGTAQGTLLAPFPFIVYTSDFCYNSGTCCHQTVQQKWWPQSITSQHTQAHFSTMSGALEIKYLVILDILSYI